MQLHYIVSLSFVERKYIEYNQRKIENYTSKFYVLFSRT